MVIVVATAVWHCPVLYILYSQKFLPYTDRRWLQQGVANVLLHGVKMYILSQFHTKIVCSFLLHRLKDKTLCWGCTYFFQIQAPHQCPRRQNGDMSHVHYWRPTHTHVKHHHKKFSSLTDLVTGNFFYPCRKCIVELCWH